MPKLNLMLHCGGMEVEREAVIAVATPPRTRTWVPIPHIEILNLVEDALKQGGHMIIQSIHALAKEGSRFFSMMQLDDGMIAGLRNSHDKIFPAGLLLGKGLFICDNLAWHGEVQLGRRHTRFIRRDLPGIVHAGVGKLMTMRGLAAEREAKYRARALCDEEAHHLMIRAVDARVMPNARIPKILAEWREPTYPEFEMRNVWSLYNDFTHVLKDSNLFHKPQATAALHGLLDAWV